MPEPIIQPDNTTMRKETAEAMPKRLGIGLNVLIQVVLGMAIFAGINRLNYRYYSRFDLSPQQTFTLSQATLNYLDKLTRDVELYIVFARDSKLYGEVQTLLEEYRLHGRQRVKLRSIDPVRDIERAEALKSRTGLSLGQNGILVISGQNKRFITEEELVIRETGTGTNKQVKEFRGEDAVTSALVGVVEGQVRRFYFITGKGARSDAAMLDALAAVTDIGRQQNFEVLPVNLSDITAITTHADGIILIGGRYDLTERELKMIDDYWNGTRAGILMLLDPNRSTKNMNQWLENLGVKPRGDRVLLAQSTSTGARKEFTVQAEFNRAVPFTQHLSTSITTFAGQTESLELGGSDDTRLKEKSIAVKPILKAVDSFWGETQFYDDLPVADEKEDFFPPVYVGAGVERGAINDESKRVESSRLVVVSNSTLLDKATMIAVNRDFVAASLNWIINREKLIGITSKPRQSYRIQLTPKQNEVIFWTTAIAMPAMVLVLGLLVWAGRRAS
jgi:ABC-type uncharacterized transport system involved in gliding motility auxiliary subunit